MADGLTAAGLGRLRAAAERQVGAERVPGLVALVARGGQVHGGLGPGFQAAAHAALA